MKIKAEVSINYLLNHSEIKRNQRYEKSGGAATHPAQKLLHNIPLQLLTVTLFGVVLTKISS